MGPLTHRESQIIREVWRGLSNKEIASKLGISTHTVNTHLRSVYSKLGVSNRMAAVRKLFGDYVDEFIDS